MKMLVAVVQDADTARALRALNAAGLEVTRLSSSGGFLREGSTTLFTVVSEEQVPVVKEILSQTCHTRTRLISPALPMSEGMSAMPTEVRVGGAVVFVLNVEEMARV